ncbi:hypothetical protein RXV86_19675 [Alisedimentitalea sp. MJ-SS2]|uniref:hypothetical protein n=1 Tax=Aliisedimentitalea sp. MJ-SS2 TaxID=3049795 RepID=UPI0029107800|nr:hypothetical protein [Alisedimentitalea sp. MJ-SS2]MDU8929616.1 hypothetical protein [Alisedimentitalea sp. MJ-SS2]
MKKLSTLAAAAALAAATAAPVAAENDPFVSTQGGLGGAGAAVIGAVAVLIFVSASDGT